MGTFPGVSRREPKAKYPGANKFFVCRKRFRISAENHPSPCPPLANVVSYPQRKNRGGELLWSTTKPSKP